MKVVINFFLILVLLPQIILPQESIEWLNSIGGSYNDFLYSVSLINDSTYIFAGESFSSDDDIFLNKGGSDILVMKVSHQGRILWQTNLGGIDIDYASDIRVNNDRGFILCGATRSNDGDFDENNGESDICVIRMNEDGVIDWTRVFGGTSNDYATSVCRSSDSGFLILGTSYSKDLDFKFNYGYSDIWVIKLNSNGETEWKRNYGGSLHDYSHSIQPTIDRGFIIAGETHSNDYDIKGNNGGADMWILKIDSVGVIQWQTLIGGVAWDGARYIIQTKDEGFIVIGYSKSKELLNQINHGGSDVCMAKLNNNGTVVWLKLLGGSKDDYSRFVTEHGSNTFLISGYTESNNGDIWENNGGFDALMIESDSLGNIKWEQIIGGSADDYARYFIKTGDSSYFAAGYSRSDNGDVINSHGESDIWVAGLRLITNIQETASPDDFILSPNPATDFIDLNMQTFQHGKNEIKIFNILGECLMQIPFSQNVDNIRIDLSSLPAGLYFLHLEDVFPFLKN